MRARGSLRPNSRRIRLGGISWLATAEVFAAELTAKSAWPGYSLGKDEISFLGVTSCGPLHDPMSPRIVDVCSPLHAVMNAGFVALGPLTILGIVLTWRIWPPGLLSRAGLVLLAVSACGIMLVGARPVNADAGLHALGAFIFFTAGWLGVGALAFKLRGAPRYLGLFCALLSLGGYAAGLLHDFALLGRGGTERLAAYPLSLWLMSMGAYFLVKGAGALTIDPPAVPCKKTAQLPAHPVEEGSRNVPSRLSVHQRERVRRPSR